MADVKRSRGREACRDGAMSTLPIETVPVARGAGYFGWTSAGREVGTFFA